MHGKMDPAVLAALPPSMQLDLLAQVTAVYVIFLRLTDFNSWQIISTELFNVLMLLQMRERLMAENRQKYQKVKKVASEILN